MVNLSVFSGYDFHIENWFIGFFLALCFGGSATDASPTLNVCDSVAHIASAETGIPTEILKTITRVETGRLKNGRFDPWPWTLNMAGNGRWFDSKSAAYNWAEKYHTAGGTNFDVGCFQINYKWHGHQFSSLKAMFDPLLGARYAAFLLKSLYKEKGNWPDAAAAYHSRTPKYAKKYKQRFERIYLSEYGTSTPEQEVQQVTETPNRYPFFMLPKKRMRSSSLVPRVRLTGTSSSLFPLIGD